MEDYLSFSSSDFHWLRPEYLWLMILWILLAIVQIWAQRDPALWSKVISKKLRPYVVTPSRKMALLFPVIWFFVVVSLVTLAAAGPSWKLVEKPGVVSNARLLICLDLSRSMDISDLKPSRAERALLKIKDLVNQPLGVPVGLMAYAETPHWVLPFTSDYSLITYTSEVLSPKIMPIQGSNVNRALHMADSIMKPLKAPSTLLWITDQLSSEDVIYLQKFVKKGPHTLEILTVATPKGGKLFNGQNHAPDPNSLAQLKRTPGVTINSFTLDHSDVEAIAQRVFDTKDFVQEPESTENQWEDGGYLLLFLAALLFLLFFRKGMVITWAFLPLLLVSCNVEDPRAEWWFSSDYIASEAYAIGDYQRVLAYANDPELRASAYYKLGDYEAAAALYEGDTTQAGKKNLSLALMAMGDYKGAQEIISGLEGSDQKLLNAALAQYTRTFGVDSITQGSKAPKLGGGDEPLETRRAKSDDEELSSDTEVDELPQDGKRVTDEVESGIRKVEEMDFPPEQSEKAQAMDAKNILMKKSLADPSDFLRKRFRYQQKRDFPNAKSKKPW